jgi:hypothetical protein
MKPDPSDLTLERYALRELSPEQLAALDARRETDPALRARLDALHADNAAFLAAHPPQRLVARLLPQPSMAPRMWMAAPMLAAALGLWFVMRPATGEPEGLPALPEAAEVAAPAPIEPSRVKGTAPKLRVHRAANGGSQPLADGAAAHRGDVLQLTYTAGRGYGVILSIDGRGTVTPQLGAPGAPSPTLDPGGAALPDAYELDDAPAFERFILVTADAPFAVDPVFAAARSLAADPTRAAQAPLSLPAGLDQSSVIVRKERP